MSQSIDYDILLELAERAREKSYAPYSHFAVGAALLCDSGRVYTGCNIENASYSATVCAERTALFGAVSAGERYFTALAVVGGPKNEKGKFCPPCGVCRQVLSEFCSEDFPIVLKTASGYTVYTLGELLPLSFALPD